MAVILNIETSTKVCSVGIAVDGIIKFIKESHLANSHAELVTLFSEEVIKNAAYELTDIDAVSVSMGPGSYTGLRIGVSTAKGFCYALDKPLIAINTLKAMAAGMVENEKSPKDFLYCPMIDARRMEVYAAFFDAELNEIKATEAVIVDENSFTELLSANKIIFAGDGAPKCEEMLSHQQNAVFKNDFNPSSTFMAKLSEQKFVQKDFEDIAYFEPFYLKDFVAGIPKVKGLKL